MLIRILHFYFKVQNFLSYYRISNLFGLVSRRNPKCHPIELVENINGLEVFKIQKTLKVMVFKNSKDEGYHNFSNAWWYNLSCPYSFSYLDVDSLYPKEYFNDSEIGHPDLNVAEDLYEYMQKVYTSLTGRSFKTVLELGVGGGEITSQFCKNDISVCAVEGTEMGVEKLRSIGISSENILKEDLRLMKHLNRSFDLVMFTEVIEHIEPFFAGKVIDLCTSHSDFVWFSAADRNSIPHWHHVNEIGISAWDNIFSFMGFSNFIQLDGRHGRADRLYIRSKTFQTLIV